MEPIMLRKSKAEALPDLPPLTVMNHVVEMTKKQKQLYKQVKEGILEIAREHGTDFTYLEALAQLTRLQQLCDSPALLRKVLEDPELPEESGKLNDLANILSEINPKENKFILFSQYAEMTDILYQWLQKNVLPKEQIGYVKGGIKAQKIEEIRHAFQEGDMQCVLMTTAGNYGLDLYEASYVICFDQLFNPQKMEQIYSRAHRNGAKKPITAINMITADSYEEKKLEILDAKRDLFKAVIEEDEGVMKKLFSSPADLLDLM
jgi:SNF2 family DNA or RNA helicase